jgi:hypothetical protein
MFEFATFGVVSATAQPRNRATAQPRNERQSPFPCKTLPRMVVVRRIVSKFPAAVPYSFSTVARFFHLYHPAIGQWSVVGSIPVAR